MYDNKSHNIVSQRIKWFILSLLFLHAYIYIGSGTAHCDAPYTRRIKTRRSVQKIQVHLTKRQDTKYFPGIDAVELISEQPSQKNKQQQFQQHCGQCQKLQLRYHVTRNPPFRNNVLYKKVKTTSYRDE